MCSGGQCWICSGAVVVIVGYFYVQWWSMVDILICSGGYVHVKSWSMVDMLMCSSVVFYGGYVHE